MNWSSVIRRVSLIRNASIFILGAFNQSSCANYFVISATGCNVFYRYLKFSLQNGPTSVSISFFNFFVGYENQIKVFKNGGLCYSISLFS
jgi:hypothetical protein